MKEEDREEEKGGRDREGEEKRREDREEERRGDDKEKEERMEMEKKRWLRIEKGEEREGRRGG